MTYLEHVGKYFLMLGRVFKRPQKFSIFYQASMKEVEDLGIKSIGIIMFISFFIGGVIALQTALNLDSPFIPDSLIGFAAKRSIILEFAPTFCCIILAGKVGSYITSSIGTMRVTEQIDALEVMGINALITLAMVMGIFGGWLAGSLSGLFSGADYIIGIQTDFNPFLIVYALIKTLIFSFLISTVPSYHGYYVKGGSIAVGRASTQAVVWTTILIVIANYFLTQMLLT